MKKYFFFILISSLTTIISAQINKIRIQRIDSTSCDYKFIAEKSVSGKFLRLSLYRFSSPDKFKLKTAEGIRTKLGFIRERPYYINKLYFDSLMKNVCIYDKFKLTKVEIKQSGDTNHIQIEMTYRKIKKR
jgi:hypothetical protein